MSNLSVFGFDGQEIRFVDGKPVANDVATVLGYKNPADAVYRIVKDKNKGICKIQTPGGMQSVSILEEAGIYQLIFGSKLPSAEKFQDWVFEEVLPAIRKTGQYNLGGRKNIIWFDRYQLFKERSKIPPGFFSIFGELSHTLISDFETAGHVMPENSGIDISVGKRWSDHAKVHYPNIDSLRTLYKHHYPDNRGVRDSFIYKDCLLPDFREWLEFTYKISHLYTYLKKNDKQGLITLSETLQIQLTPNLFDLKLLK